MLVTNTILFYTNLSPVPSTVSAQFLNYWSQNLLGRSGWGNLSSYSIFKACLLPYHEFTHCYWGKESCQVCALGRAWYLLKLLYYYIFVTLDGGWNLAVTVQIVCLAIGALLCVVTCVNDQNKNNCFNSYHIGGLGQSQSRWDQTPVRTLVSHCLPEWTVLA